MTTLRPLSVIALFACAALQPALGAEAGPFAAADLGAASQLRDRARAGSGAFEIVASLTTEVGPRLSGSAGDAAAVVWAERLLRDAGFANVRTEPVTVPHWVRGDASVILAGTPARPLVAAALGGSSGTPDEGLAGEVVRFADLAALRAAPAGSLSGRIAFVAKRMTRSRDGHGYGETVDARVEGPSVASAAGASAFLLRSVGTDHDRVAHTGITQYGTAAPIPAVALSNPDADLLERRLARGTQTVQVRVTARTLPPAQSANVIGEIVGRDHPEQVVLLGAHLDSWDLGEGAIDDGAGVAIVTAAARTILAAGHAPRRTIRVVLFAHEEGGGNGARAYAEHTAGATEPHVAALEADFGGGRVYGLRNGAAPAVASRLGPLLKVLAPLGIGDLGPGARGGADIGALRARGVAVFDLSQDGSRYFDIHHTANDTLSALDAADLDQVVAAYAATAWLLADSDAVLGPPPANR